MNALVVGVVYGWTMRLMNGRMDGGMYGFVD